MPIKGKGHAPSSVAVRYEVMSIPATEWFVPGENKRSRGRFSVNHSSNVTCALAIGIIKFALFQ